jgi:hypothetical protein
MRLLAMFSIVSLGMSEFVAVPQITQDASISLKFADKLGVKYSGQWSVLGANGHVADDDTIVSRCE